MYTAPRIRELFDALNRELSHKSVRGGRPLWPAGEGA